MINTIIGGAIAAVIGALAGLGASLWLNCLSRKKERAMMVNDLLVDIEANLKICHDPASSDMWWMVKFKTQAYDSYKGRILFLPGEVRNTLSEVVHTMEGVNTAIQVQLWRSGSGVAKPHEFRPIKHPDYLEQQLTFCRDELQKWQKQHTSKFLFLHLLNRMD
jgi:hypothetical protein